MRDSPCHYCLKRVRGCHAKCPDRKEWLEELAMEKEQIAKQKIYTSYINGTKIPNIQAWYTKKRRSGKKF